MANSVSKTDTKMVKKQTWIHLKLSLHCKSTICQLKKRKKEKETDLEILAIIESKKNSMV